MATGGGGGGRGVHCGADLGGLPLLRGRPLPPSHLPTAKATTASVVSSNCTFLGENREKTNIICGGRWRRVAAVAAGGSIVPYPAPNMVYMSEKIMIGQQSFLRTAADADEFPPPWEPIVHDVTRLRLNQLFVGLAIFVSVC